MVDEIERDKRWESVIARAKRVTKFGVEGVEIIIQLTIQERRIEFQHFLDEMSLEWAMGPIYQMTLDHMVEEIDKLLEKNYGI